MKLAWQDSDVADMPAIGTRIDTFDGLAQLPGGPGARLAWLRERATAFRGEFASTGTPDSVTTCDLVTLPYPTRFGLFRATRAIAPFLSITNRMLVIRWRDTDGRPRVLLFEPSDVELGRNTPYFAELSRRTPRFIQSLLVKQHGSVLEHLHTQDVRRWVGTTTPQDDLGSVIAPAFPNAKLIVQRDELRSLACLHPLQRPWYQPDAYRAVPPDALLAVDGSRLLGPGVALVATPGHVAGNQTLVLNTSTGIWASSENAIAAECLTPEHSRMPGIARWAKAWQQEVILNANTIESTAEQYNSMVLEKTLVDRAQSDSRFLQFFPSSELTAAWTNPGTSPTFTHRAIQHAG